MCTLRVMARLTIGFACVELGINFWHIRSKTMTVLNPLRTVDEHIMDDADLYGPVMFYFLLGVFLFFVSCAS